jgi:hypothetical protein
VTLIRKTDRKRPVLVQTPSAVLELITMSVAYRQTLQLVMSAGVDVCKSGDDGSASPSAVSYHAALESFNEPGTSARQKDAPNSAHPK